MWLPSSKLRRQQRYSAFVSVVAGGLFRIGQRYALSQFHRRSLVWWSRHPVLHAILVEYHSLLGRIQNLCRKQPWRSHVDLGPAMKTLPNGHLAHDTRTLARIHGTQTMFSTTPWATLVDLEIYLAGWDKGAEWALGKEDFCNELQAKGISTSDTSRSARLGQ